jgi:hypothetical protein
VARRLQDRRQPTLPEFHDRSPHCCGVGPDQADIEDVRFEAGPLLAVMVGPTQSALPTWTACGMPSRPSHDQRGLAASIRGLPRVVNGVALRADDDGGPAGCDHIGGILACITNSGTRMHV